MSDYSYEDRDFEHPSILFRLEDKLRGLIGGHSKYKSYFKTFGLQGNENILDFGCGGGVGSRCLASFLNKDGHLTCVDTSNYWITRARKRVEEYSNVECRLGDIRELDIPDSSFDIISTIHVIHDISPSERQDIINALSRKLKADGIFFIKEPIKKSHGMPIDEIRTLLSNAGLKEIESSKTESEYTGKYAAMMPLSSA